jgi:hypothetical protein
MSVTRQAKPPAPIARATVIFKMCRSRGNGFPPFGAIAIKEYIE